MSFLADFSDALLRMNCVLRVHGLREITVIPLPPDLLRQCSDQLRKDAELVRAQAHPVPATFIGKFRVGGVWFIFGELEVPK